MAHNLLAGLRDNLLLRASVATVAGIVLLGVASGALPLTCFAGLAACQTGPVGTEVSAPDVKAETKVATATGKTTSVKTMPAVSPPTLTSNDVVGATFAMLDVDLATSASDSELKTRRVKTVAIGPDGQPQTAAQATPARTVALAPRQVTTTTPAVTHPAAKVATSAPPAAIPDEHPTAVASELATKPPAADSKTAVVKSGGANVRSSPSKGKSTVLFALPGGTTVTIGDDSHGWLKVTDAKGRSGWVYQDLLVRD